MVDFRLVTLALIGALAASSAQATIFFGKKPKEVPVVQAPVVIQAEPLVQQPAKPTLSPEQLALKATRTLMNSGADVPYGQLQALADSGDAMAAYKVAKLLEARTDTDFQDDAAHYYAVAAFGGRDFAVKPLLRLVRDYGITFPKNRLPQIRNALEVRATAGNTQAAAALAEMLIDGRLFDRDPVAGVRFVKLAAANGDASVALRAGIAALGDPIDTAAGNPVARSFLELAAAGTDLSAKVTASNLLAQLGPGSAAPEAAAIPADSVTQAAEETSASEISQ